MRGVPGSRKTTTANFLAGTRGVIHSVDDYHIQETGIFLWDDNKAEEYYEKNFDAFVQSLDAGTEIVVCDCINITRDEYLKYVQEARVRGYTTATVTMTAPTPSKAASSNQHDVSMEQIAEMYENWED
jgi:tRNA uridine 5-carbamoylmethylation protein Kti12